MERFVLLGSILLAIVLAGFYGAYHYGRRTKRFRWSEYLAIVIWPILAILVLSYLIDIRVLTLFFVSCGVGFLLEYLVGLTYHKTLNQRLWTYNRSSIHGYTSLLSIPLWGVVGVAFWFLGKMIGL